MTGGGGGGRKRGGEEKKGRKLRKIAALCVLPFRSGEGFERKRGGWCEDESRTECRPGRKEKRKKKEIGQSI